MAAGTPSDWDAFTDAQGQNDIDRNVRQYTDWIYSLIKRQHLKTLVR